MSDLASGAVGAEALLGKGEPLVTNSEAPLRLPEQQVAYTISKLHQVKHLLRHKLRPMALRRGSVCLPCVELALGRGTQCSLLTQNSGRLASAVMYSTRTDTQLCKSLMRTGGQHGAA